MMAPIAVIGGGMMGVSAARHLSANGTPVVLVGPGETPTGGAHSVYSSWHDEGRITRILDPDPVWAELAVRSIRRYPRIEAASGVPFHRPCGVLRVGAPGSEDMIGAEASGLDRGATIDRLVADLLRDRFPQLCFGDEVEALWETGEAGIIRPRAFVRAQKSLCLDQGVDFVEGVALGVEELGQGVSVRLEGGDRIEASSVLLAPGAFGPTLDLPVPLPKLQMKARTVLLAEVGDDQLARFGSMPAFLYLCPPHPDFGYVYVLPPIRYPDGRSYIKIGANDSQDPDLTTGDELREWFRSEGSSRSAKGLKETLLQLLPGLAPKSYVTRPCAVTFTATGRPTIDRLSKRVFIAVGGNGSAAKSADEIGRLAACLVRGEDLSSEFEGVFAARRE